MLVMLMVAMMMWIKVMAMMCLMAMAMMAMMAILIASTDSGDIKKVIRQLLHVSPADGADHGDG